MTECTFHPENHATGELLVRDAEIGEKINLPICENCIDAYDKQKARYMVNQE